MENLRAFIVKYVGPTNSNGSRVKIADQRFGKSKTLSYDHSTDTKGTAVKYLEELGIKVRYQAEMKDAYILLTDNFDVSDITKKPKKKKGFWD